MAGDQKVFGMAPEKGRWLFVVLGLVINLCLGSVYSYGVFKKHIELNYNSITAEANVAEVKGLRETPIGKDLLGKVFALKKEQADQLLAKYADINAELVTGIFGLKTDADKANAEKLATALKSLSQEQLGKILSIKKVTSLQSSLPFMTFLAFFSILMFFGGRIMEKLGPKKLVMIGGVIVGLGWFLSGFATNIWMLTLTYGVIAGSGVGLAYGCPVAVATKWFPDKKGLAVGLALAGFGGSALLTANIANLLIKKIGLEYTFMSFGGVFLIIILILALPLAFPVAGWTPAGWKAAAAASSATDFDQAGMVKTGSFWGLFFCYLIGCTAGLMAIGVASPVGTDVINVSADTAAFFTGIFAIFNAVGRPLFGSLTDSLKPQKAGLINLLMILVASGLMLIAKEGDVALYVVAIAMFWLCLGGWLAIAPAATASFFGAKNYARNYGTVFFAYGLGAIIGGLISSNAVDLLGSLQMAFYPTAGLAALGLLIALALIKAPKKA